MDKILMVSCEGLGKGGVQDVIMKIVRNSPSDLFHYDIVLFTDEVRYYDSEFQKYGNIYRIILKDKSPIVNKLKYRLKGIIIYRCIKKIIKNNGPYKAIHCHNNFDSAFCLMAAKECGIPVRIVHSHNPRELGNKRSIFRDVKNYCYRKRLLKYGTDFIACSQQAGEYLFGKNIEAKIIPNSISISDNRIVKKRSLDVSDEVRLLNVGRFSFQKNQHRCIEILKKLKDIGICAKLTLMGSSAFDDSNEEVKKCKELIRSFDLAEDVTFLEGDGDVIEQMENSDIFLFPSTYEGFGIVLLEAQSVGMKCVASTNVPKETNAGLVTFCELNNDEQWVEAIKRYTEDNIRNIPNMKRYSVETIVPLYLKIYTS